MSRAFLEAYRRKAEWECRRRDRGIPGIRWAIAYDNQVMMIVEQILSKGVLV